MTEKDKDKIAQLRAQGYSYTDIADELQLTVSYVKVYCSRNNIKIAVCPQCGIQVYQTQGKKQKRFCSDKCRQEWWNNHPEEGNRNPHHIKVCPVCLETIKCYRARHRVYCSRQCYLAAVRKAVPNYD